MKALESAILSLLASCLTLSVSGQSVPSNQPSLQPSTSPSGTTIDRKNCSIEEIDLIEVFTDHNKLLLGIGVAAIATLPAVSVYCRHTAERPKQTYLYSCIIKFIAAFFSISILVGGIYEIYIQDCPYDTEQDFRTIFPFFAALVTEIVEFIFDFGRLVLFFGDPGTIDFYQNARWNSNVTAGGTIQSTIRCCAVGLSSLPIALLMFVMWNFNLVAQIIGLFYQEEDSDGDDGETTFTASFISNGFWLSVFFLYITFSFSCVGGYFLLRMAFPCCHGWSTNGEEQGVGYYWTQFKLIAVDIPGLISTLLVSPSSLVFFWTAEFVNDTFPMVVEYLVEKFFYTEDDDKDDCDNYNIEEEKNIEKLYDETDKKDVLTYNIGNDGPYQTIFLPIQVSKSRGTRKIKSYKIQREFPSSSQLNGHVIDESKWNYFCDEINCTLESIVPLEERRADRWTRIICIGFGIIMTFVYWDIIFRIRPNANYNGEAVVFDDDYSLRNFDPPTMPIQSGPFFSIVVALSLILAFICVKLCFPRDLTSESEILARLEQVCEEHSKESEFYFHVKTQNNICVWMRQGGLACTKGIHSLKSIECNFVVNKKKNTTIKGDNMS